MERRKHKRIYINEKAKIILDEKEFRGYIVDASETGISFMFTSPFRLRDEAGRTTVIELGSDDIERLNCEVVWANKGLYTGNTIAFGMKIIEPTKEYRDWIHKKLTISSDDEIT